MYRTLDPDVLVGRIEVLHRRIGERFPDRNLRLICGELLDVARESRQRIEWVQQPLVWLRVDIGLLVFLFVFALVFGISAIELEETGTVALADLVQVIEASINEVVLIAAAFLFLARTERRVKQKRTLRSLHELRSLAHVIDVHQLAKDPDRIYGRGPDTASSPKESMTPYELVRYLNYCSEMLSLIGKLAALYIQYFDDDVAVAAVTEVEELTLGLSRKVWQKIMIVHQDRPDLSPSTT